MDVTPQVLIGKNHTEVPPHPKRPKGVIASRAGAWQTSLVADKVLPFSQTKWIAASLALLEITAFDLFLPALIANWEITNGR